MTQHQLRMHRDKEDAATRAQREKEELQKRREMGEEEYEKMVQFMLKHGHCLGGPGDAEEDDRALVEWATLQRKLSRQHKLDPVRKKLLDQIGFDWGHSKKRSRGYEDADKANKRNCHDDGDDQASVGSNDSYMVI